jgi:transketolase
VVDRFKSFGWDAIEIDGNDLQQLLQAFAWARMRQGNPKAVVLKTRPGCGVKRIEQRDRAHFVRIDADEWDAVASELEIENA